MNAKSILPKVEINTGNGKVTLVNATIVNIVPHVVPVTPKGSHAEGLDTHEQEQVSFTFQKIEYTGTSGGLASADSWNTPGTPGKKKKK
jgi:type VI protein secretion system component Hcp